MSFDVGASLRRLKPDKKGILPARRPDAELSFVDDAPDEGAELLFDTTVYIDNVAGRLPVSADQIIRSRRISHSGIALAELTHLFGRLDPANARSKAVIATVKQVIMLIPARRLSLPSVRAFGEAGIVAGLIARLRGAVPANRQALLNDVLLYLHAAEQGATLLTRNIADFDLIQQVAPGGRVLFYRQVD